MDKVGLNIEHIETNKLIPYINNPRKNDNAVTKVAASIKEFGFKIPITVDKDNVIITGHTRLKAAIKLGMDKVPIIKIEDLTPSQIKAFRIADNKVSEEAEWDMKLLEIELEGLEDIFTGFEEDEFDKIMGIDKEVEEDNFDEEPPENPISKRGDIWLLGRHRLMCGDSTDKAAAEKLMDGVKADLGFCDPPYNLGYEYNEYDDNKSEAEYIEFSHNWYQILKDIASRKIVTLGTKNIGIMASLDKIAGVACWVKKNWITSCHIAKLQQWEPIFFYGDFLSYKRTSDLFEVNRVYQEDVGEKHTCPKQIKLIADIVENYSNKNETVVDLFGGSGSTLIACEQLDRICYMMELDPKYIDVIINRWEQFTGEKAILLTK